MIKTSELIQELKHKSRPKSNPQWTILYNISPEENQKWVGTAWEFFDNHEVAEIRYKILKEDKQYCPGLRPFNYDCDNKHLGAAHSDRR